MDRMSSSDFSRGKKQAAHPATFEETWPRYEFAELVRLALAVGAWLAKGRRRIQRRRLEGSGSLLPGEIKPAE
jgi:hypothetical protein